MSELHQAIHACITMRKNLYAGWRVVKTSTTMVSYNVLPLYDKATEVHCIGQIPTFLFVFALLSAVLLSSLPQTLAPQKLTFSQQTELYAQKGIACRSA